MYRGDYAVNSIVRFMWNAFAVAGQSITRSVNGSIRIYKNNSTTQRTSAAGITDTEDFDALTGLMHVNIDLSNNTDAGFYAAGNDYQVVIEGTTIDGKVINAVIAEFSIENRNAQANLTRIDGLALVLATLNLLKLNIVNTGGDAVVMSSTGGNGTGLLVSGNGSGEGAKFTGGATGNAVEAVGGATSGSAIRATATAGNSHAIEAIGIGSGAGARIKGGATGVGLHAEGGATVGPGFLAQAMGTGHGIEAEGGTGGGDGIFAQANGGGGDGIEGIGNGAGADIKGDIVGNITGNLSGSVGSVAAGGITAASIATDAIDGDAIAASAVAEIQSGLALDATVAKAVTVSAEIAAVQADTNDIQTRLPVALVGGLMASDVLNMEPNTVTASALAADAGAEIGAAVRDTALTELGAVPAAAPSMGDALEFVYMQERNERDVTATSRTFKNQAGVVIATAVLSDDLTTFRKTRYT